MVTVDIIIIVFAPVLVVGERRWPRRRKGHLSTRLEPVCVGRRKMEAEKSWRPTALLFIMHGWVKKNKIVNLCKSLIFCSGLLQTPPECRLLELAHLFLTFRAREKWSRMASLCHKDFYFVDLERVDRNNEDSFEDVVDIEAFIGRGRFCSGGLPRVLRNLVSIRAFPSPEVCRR